jgi:hypothetical protein
MSPREPANRPAPLVPRPIPLFSSVPARPIRSAPAESTHVPVMSAKDDPNASFSLFGDDALSPPPASPFPAREPHPEPAPRPAAPPPPGVSTAKPAPTPAPSAPPSSGAYDASSIEVLEGLEPVRMRPGMYIGGTDERALHHLFAEVLDNSMDEAVAGFAKTIEVKLDADGYLSVRDDGRGMPVDEHPKHPGKSALEVIMTVLHAGGKFSGKAYETSGGLHGVGASVVNALSELVEVTVWRDGFEHRQSFARGKPLGPVEQIQPSKKRAPRCASSPTTRSSAKAAASSRRACTAWPAPRPICSAACRSNGPATPRGSTTRPRPRPPSTSPTAWPTSWPSAPRGWNWSPPTASRAASSARARPARSSGPSPGPRAVSASMTASCSRTATPCRPPRAAPTRAACAPP